MTMFSSPMHVECLGVAHSYYRGWWSAVAMSPIMLLGIMCGGRVAWRLLNLKLKNSGDDAEAPTSIAGLRKLAAEIVNKQTLNTDVSLVIFVVYWVRPHKTSKQQSKQNT